MKNPRRPVTRLFLLRHGEVENRGIFYGQLDLALSPGGQEQAEQAAKALEPIPLAAVYSSDLVRAAKGAQLIADHHNVPLYHREALREMRLGVLENISFAQATERFPQLKDKAYADMVDFRMPEGETIREVATRVHPLVAQIREQHAGGCVALVCHNTVNRLILGAALGLPLEDIFHFKQDFGCINVVDWQTKSATGNQSVSPCVRLLNWLPHGPRCH